MAFNTPNSPLYTIDLPDEWSMPLSELRAIAAQMYYLDIKEFVRLEGIIAERDKAESEPK